jgi:ligand-binding SRPBCC domain-containing protein
MASILLDSTFALPARAIQQGFTFRFGRLSEAFRNLYPAPFENRFSAVQFVPRPLEEVFSFFSRAESMEAITPPWIHFRIVKLTSNSLEKGALLDFKLKIHHLPIRCRSLIEGWELRRKFFDGQVKGPYMKWHHACRFERVAGGTLVVDEVVYRLPAGRIGILLGGRMVKNCVHEIFSFRCRKLSEVFPR